MQTDGESADSAAGTNIGFFSMRVRLSGIVGAVFVVTCSATVFGFFGQVWWFFDLFSHFRMQYLAGLIVLLLWFCISRQWYYAVNAALFMLPNALLIIPWLLPVHADPVSIDLPVFRAVLMNVDTDSGSPIRALELIRDLEPDFFLVEEVNDRWLAHFSALSSEYPFLISCPRDDNFGIALYSRLPMNDSGIVHVGPTEAPSLIASIQCGEVNLSVFGTHPIPPSEAIHARWRDEHLADIPRFLATWPPPLMLLGDLNMTPWSSHYRPLLKATGLVDSAVGHGLLPTWPTYLPFFLIPLDHCFVSENIFIRRRKIGTYIGSDHFPVIIDFSLKPAGQSVKIG